jgi:hypothetical protein
MMEENVGGSPESRRGVPPALVSSSSAAGEAGHRDSLRDDQRPGPIVVKKTGQAQPSFSLQPPTEVSVAANEVSAKDKRTGQRVPEENFLTIG